MKVHVSDDKRKISEPNPRSISNIFNTSHGSIDIRNRTVMFTLFCKFYFTLLKIEFFFLI